MIAASSAVLVLAAVAPATEDAPRSVEVPPSTASSTASATDHAMGVPLSVGYYGPYLIQPGVAVGARVGLRDWSRPRTGRRRAFTTTGSLFVGPKLAFFSRPGNHLSTLLEAELGYQIRRHPRRLYSAFSAGAGYMTSFQVVAVTVDLGDGRQRKHRETRHAFVPTLSYAFGQRTTERLGWYVELTYGHRFSTQLQSALLFALELGMTFQLPTGTRRSR